MDGGVGEPSNGNRGTHLESSNFGFPDFAQRMVKRFAQQIEDPTSSGTGDRPIGKSTLRGTFFPSDLNKQGMGELSLFV